MCSSSFPPTCPLVPLEVQAIGDHDAVEDAYAEGWKSQGSEETSERQVAFKEGEKEACWWGAINGHGWQRK